MDFLSFKKWAKVVLNLKDVTAGYNESPIVKEISFSVKAGEFIGIIGRNGAGKSTLLKAMVGVIKPFSGDILLGECSILDMSYNQRAKLISYVSQSELPPIGIDVYEYVRMGRFCYGGLWGAIGKEHDLYIDKALKTADVYHLKNRKLATLSGGELALVRIARAIAGDQKLLVFDEPTNHLDVGHAVMLMKLFKDLASDKNHIVIVAIHDLNLAMAWCDRLVLIVDGRIKKIGMPHKVLTKDTLKRYFGVKAEFYKTSCGKWQFFALDSDV